MPDPLQFLEDAARRALDAGNTRLANAKLKQMQSSAPDDVRTLELEGDIATECEEYERARVAYTRLCTQASSPEARGIGEHSLGLLDLELEDREAAREHLTVAANLYDQAGATRRLKSALGTLGLLANELGELQLAVDTFRRLLAIGPTGDPDDEEEAVEDAITDAEAIRMLADTLRLQGQLTEAEAAFREAITRFEALGEDAGKSYCLDGLGVVMQLAGCYDEAETLHLQALTISETEEDFEGLSAVYGNLTMLSFHRKHWDKAQGWARRALQVDQELQNEDGIATTHLHLAMIELERNNLAAAEKHLKEAHAYFRAHGTPLDMLSVISNYGELHRHQGKLDEAEREVQQVLQMATEMGHRDGIAKANDQLAELRKAQGRPAEARELWKLALSQYEALGSPAIVGEIKANLEKLR